jgi:hypothetical protein
VGGDGGIEAIGVVFGPVYLGVQELFGLNEMSEKYFGNAVDGVLDSNLQGLRMSLE